MHQEKHILIAEDEEADIVLLQLALEENGVHDHEVKMTRDGAETLDYLYRRGPFQDRPQGNPGLVILDLKLPKITGLEILIEIRANSGTKDLPVVIFSSSLHESDRRNALSNGANAFVVKPMELDAFHQSIQSILLLHT